MYPRESASNDQTWERFRFANVSTVTMQLGSSEPPQSATKTLKPTERKLVTVASHIVQAESCLGSPFRYSCRPLPVAFL